MAGGETRLHLSRTFPAPREKVFRAWTDPAELKKWFGPEGYSTPIAEVDLRVGGQYRLGMMKLPDGQALYVVGTYREIRPPEKLVYTWRWEATPELGETLVTVEFHDRGGSTEVSLTHELFPTDKARSDHEKGWSSILSQLTNAL